MKRNFLYVLLTIILCTPALAYDWATNPGDGSEANPYQISTPEQLMSIGSNADLLDKNFVLTNDIVFDPNNNPNHIFTDSLIARDIDSYPLFQGTAFSGVFDGKGYSVNNLTINASSKDYIGLFGYTDGAIIQNLGLNNVSLSSDGGFVGGLIGENHFGTIINCHAVGSVSGDFSVAGLIGDNKGSLIDCYASGTINGSYNIGGLVGCNYGSLINCNATGSVYGDKGEAGGLVGCNYGPLTACFVKNGFVSGEAVIGGLVGSCYNGQLTLCYATGTVSGTVLHRWISWT